MKHKTILLTGLPSSGKTTIAKKLKECYDNCIWIDGDIVRKTISSDLGFSEEDRKENARRVVNVCKFLNQNHTVIVSMITPTEDIRDIFRTIDNFHLVFIDTPIETCIERDVKGLYKLAKEGKIKNMTGLDGIFEKPKGKFITVKTNVSVDYSLIHIYFSICENIYQQRIISNKLQSTKVFPYVCTSTR